MSYLGQNVQAVLDGVTPPTADVSQKLATTAFVQNSGLHFNNTAGIAFNVSKTLLPTDMGGWGQFQSPTAAVTLPALSAVPLGSTFTFISDSSNGGSIKGNGAETIQNQFGVGVNSYTLAKGETVTVVANGGASLWYIVSSGFGGTSFAASKAANGYQKLPSGLIMQWGRVNVTIPAGSQNTYLHTAVAFPIAFPSGVLSVQVSREGIPTGSNQWFNLDSESSSAAGTNIVISSSYTLATTQTILWFAIGY